MKLFKNTFLYLAAIFLLLHSFVPHFHQEDGNHGANVFLTEGHQTRNLLHIIQEVLSSSDPGNNHLEEFTSTSQIVFDYFLHTDEAVQLLEIKISKFIQSRQEVLIYTSEVETTSTRGPPSA